MLTHLGNRTWLTAAGSRLAQMAVLLFLVVLTVFVLTRTGGGDPANVYLGLNATAEQVAAFHQKMGFDRPLPEQFLKLLAQLLSGDFGTSLTYQAPVSELILQKLPATLLLMFTGYLLAILIGVSVGVVGASMQNTPVESLVRMGSAVLYAQPEFIVGICVLVLATTFVPSLPIVGMGNVQGTSWAAIGDTLMHLIGPALALGIARSAHFARMTLESMLMTLNQDYITTHNASGFGTRRIVFVYALRNALLPITTAIGIEVRFLFAGAVLTEVTFSWPGIGRLIFDGILNRDAALIVGVFFIVAILTMLLSLATDMVSATLDPRIRLGRRDVADGKG